MKNTNLFAIFSWLLLCGSVLAVSQDIAPNFGMVLVIALSVVFMGTFLAIEVRGGASAGGRSFLIIRSACAGCLVAAMIIIAVGFGENKLLGQSYGQAAFLADTMYWLSLIGVGGLVVDKALSVRSRK